MAYKQNTSAIASRNMDVEEDRGFEEAEGGPGNEEER